uniref:Odorant binding protein 2A n=1 Tax=Gorilla gorilla gorilla TaxID=9595 RepID=A0A2I2ZF36_GORGO
MKTLFLVVTLGLATALSFTREEEDEGGSVHPEENPDAEDGGAWQIQRLWGQEAHVPAGAARDGRLRLLLQRPAPRGACATWESWRGRAAVPTLAHLATSPAGRNPDTNLEALEEFKKLVQRKGLSEEDIFTPLQTGSCAPEH